MSLKARFEWRSRDSTSTYAAGELLALEPDVRHDVEGMGRLRLSAQHRADQVRGRFRSPRAEVVHRLEDLYGNERAPGRMTSLLPVQAHPPIPDTREGLFTKREPCGNETASCSGSSDGASGAPTAARSASAARTASRPSPSCPRPPTRPVPSRQKAISSRSPAACDTFKPSSYRSAARRTSPWCSAARARSVNSSGHIFVIEGANRVRASSPNSAARPYRPGSEPWCRDCSA